jgi:GT2 family glycosyltransferase
MKIDILVLNYNGKDLLEKNLPSVIESAGFSKHECKVVVVDNKSTDKSAEFLKGNFKGIEIFHSERNDVLCSYNEAIKDRKSDMVIFLNNDMKVKEDFIDHLAIHFKDENVFFAAPRLLNPDGTYNGGKSYLEFKAGIIRAVPDKEDTEHSGTTPFISTGAFRRELFISLGGFDRFYLPGIWEDVDICYRALLLGKKGLYEPKSIVWHDESTTFKREYGNDKKLVLAHRNMFLFLWKNITDKRMLRSHVFFMPFRFLYALISGKRQLAMGFVQALSILPHAVRRRKRNMRFLKGRRKLKDKDIIR